MSSFIGCKISLISKAGIRYEGILYTIDPRESTVALSKVKSFGTEDRKVERIIPPRDEIYEYIIFRGSDIQDLNVCEPSKESTLLSEDSAIVRAETSISGNLPPGVMNSEMHNTDGAWSTNNHRLPASEKPVNHYTKPSVNSKSKEADIQLNSTAQPIGSNRNNPSSSDTKKQFTRKPESNNIGEHKYERTKSKIDKSQKYNTDRYNSNYHEYEYPYDSSYKYSGQHHGYHGSGEYGLSASRDYYHHMKTIGGGTGAAMSQMAPTGGRPRRADYYHRPDQYQYYNGPVDRSKLRGFESSEGGGTRDYGIGSGLGYGLASAQVANHPLGGGQAHYYEYRARNGDIGARIGGKKSKSSQQQQTPQSARDGGTESIKRDETFKEDYDFETANAIIAKELENLNVTNQDKKESKDAECNDSKEDGECSEHSDGAGYYDKTKSFFDNISSEMLDRANGKSVRPMNRKEERKINVETFGVAESSNRNLGRNASKWNRNSRYYSSKSTRSGGTGGGNGVYKSSNSNETFKKDVAKQPSGPGPAGNNHRGSGYGNNRRAVLVDGAGRAGDEY